MVLFSPLIIRPFPGDVQALYNVYIFSSGFVTVLLAWDWAVLLVISRLFCPRFLSSTSFS